ncbi:MAG: hypothetical protein WA659_05160 [Candidatus Aquirickettsiella sp.]
MPNFVALFNRFKRVCDQLKNDLENDLPSFDEAKFFQVFGRSFENNLSAHGKNIYARGLDQNVLTAIHKEVNEKLTQNYKEILANALPEMLISFDSASTAHNAQNKFELKLEESKQALLEKLNNELAAVDQAFTNPTDKKALNTAFSNSLSTIGTKYKTNLNELDSIWSELAKWNLHLINNKESETKSKNTDFALTQTDPKKLSIGIAPNPTTGWRLDIDNLTERLMHIVANLKPGEKIHIVLTCPDREGIIRQIGEIGGGRSPAVALAIAAFFYFLAMFCNNDEERKLAALKKVIEKYGIVLNPENVTTATKQLNTNAKPIVTRKKGSLEPAQIDALQKANQELIKSLKEVNEAPKPTHSANSSHEPDPGYESGGSSPDEEDEEVSNSRNNFNYRR